MGNLVINKNNRYSRSLVGKNVKKTSTRLHVPVRDESYSPILAGRIGGVGLADALPQDNVKRRGLIQPLSNVSYMCKHINFLRRLTASQLRKDKDLVCEGFSRTMFAHARKPRTARLLESFAEQVLPQVSPGRLVFTRTQNNMFASATNTVTGNTYISLASGSTGLQGKKRTSPVAAEALGEYFAQRFLPAEEKVRDVLRTSSGYGYKLKGVEEKIPMDFYTKLGYLDSFSKSFMKGVSKITKRVLLKDEFSNRNVIKNRSISFVNVLLDGKLSHNGIRKPKKRRV